MTRETLLAEILHLPPADRIELLSDAWDSIAATPEGVPIPEWHVEELERRVADRIPNFVPWRVVRERLQDSK